MSQEFTDEHLSAFLDGELDAETSAALEAALETDPSLADRIEALARIDDRLRPAFAETIAERTPDRFAAMLEPHAAPAARPSWLRWFAPQIAGPVAAAMVLGVFGGAFLNPGEPVAIDSTADGALVARAGLEKALSEAASGDTIQTGLGPMRVRLSFISEGGAACRQFHLSQQEAIACRSGEDWVIDTLAPAQADVFSADYQMANGDVAPGVATALERLGVREVLAGDDELVAIDRKWLPPATE